ncbi:hypothetical protein EUGRSUZ_G00555 [Eucalyptus grandis]|uniref:Uncharacterized protein n=2 Tax=Eucalyptus grandis TaxID=71139 RepID=A0ACC3JZY2_EUCGR|nr:hypothetical protein EUGRSUZ_G00555 [Eucalyptus grandis]
MAMRLVRFRRALAAPPPAALRRPLAVLPQPPAAPAPAPSPSRPGTPPPAATALRPLSSSPPAAAAAAASLLFSRSLAYNAGGYNDGDKIDPDTVLFEGCDFNHWLITVDFPKDPKPTPEEMVRTYEETCARGLNISLEEAKKRIYACSTTTYQGFQAVMTEAESEQFRDLPGVVFILPDSYIDPQNKEYGGDKYENGVITHRPPPVQYGRPGGRGRERNRNYEQPRYDQQGGQMPNRQGSPQYGYQGPMHRDAPQNHPPQQSYGPPGQGERRNPMPMGNMNYAPGGRDPYQGQRRDPVPSYQGNYNQQGHNNSYNQQQRDLPQGDRWSSAPPVQNDYRSDNRNYGPAPGGTYGQGSDGFQGQGTGSAQGQGMNPSYGQNYMGYGEGQRFTPPGQKNVQEDQCSTQQDQRSYRPEGQGGIEQRRY